jgi:hypothetical protein
LAAVRAPPGLSANGRVQPQQQPHPLPPQRVLTHSRSLSQAMMGLESTHSQPLPQARAPTHSDMMLSRNSIEGGRRESMTMSLGDESPTSPHSASADASNDQNSPTSASDSRNSSRPGTGNAQAHAQARSAAPWNALVQAATTDSPMSVQK